jgi:signal transduction histidine kinase
LATFTHPIRIGGRIFGAVIGIQAGSGTLVRDDIFLEALAASLSVSIVAGGAAPPSKEAVDEVKKERLNAIIETAATVNHEINNPLTAVLGNVQLLLMRGGELDEEIVRKLKIVEESAIRIKEVTQKLMNISSDNVIEYTSGSKMIDLPEE